MKNFKKITTAVLLVVICLSLCSCRALDDLRDRHAFYDENGIIYKNVLYIKVDEAYDLNFFYKKDVFVTDTDVPVLLSGMFGYRCQFNTDETILCGYDVKTSSGVYYIREDKYPAYMSSIKNGINYTELGFGYYDYYIGQKVDYILSYSEKQLVLAALATEPYNEEYVVDDQIDLFIQSDNGLFKKDLQYSIIKSAGCYYIAEYDENGSCIKTHCVDYDAKGIFETFFDFYNGNYGF